jgi:DNA-binding NtrC family response regulator
MKVLLVDDEANAREVYSRLFELGGHQVVAAADAEEAGRAIDGDRFDLAVIDVVLPGRDGFSVLEHFKRSQPGARAVVVSAHDVRESSERAAGLDADGFLAKPLRWAELSELLTHAGRKAR